MGIKDFMTRKLLERQMKNVPPEQREMLIKAIQENPEFFEKIAKEIQEKTKQGKNQTAASMEVMRKYQSELQRIVTGSQGKN
jgi:primosomal protein N'